MRLKADLILARKRGSGKLKAKLSPLSDENQHPEAISVPQPVLTMSRTPQLASKTFIVEHLDPELGPWSALEYLAIAQEANKFGVTFCLSSVSNSLDVPAEIRNAQGLVIEKRSVEELYYEKDKSRVCLLDPAAETELAPSDGTIFDTFLFGGILGTMKLLCKELSGGLIFNGR